MLRCNGDLQAAAERLVRGGEDNAMSESSSGSSGSDSDSDSDDSNSERRGSSGGRRKDAEQEMMRVLMPDVSGDLFEHLDTNLEEEAALLQKFVSMLP